jgi:hypothetical protein
MRGDCIERASDRSELGVERIPLHPFFPEKTNDLSKMKTWLEKPEQAEILGYLREMSRLDATA